MGALIWIWVENEKNKHSIKPTLPNLETLDKWVSGNWCKRTSQAWGEEGQREGNGTGIMTAVRETNNPIAIRIWNRKGPHVWEASENPWKGAAFTNMPQGGPGSFIWITKKGELTD